MNHKRASQWSLLVVATWVSLHVTVSLAQDWPAWRGPTLDGHAPKKASGQVPVAWSENQNVAWRAPVPGKGHASPIVVEGSVFLLTHQEQDQTICLLKYDAMNGAPMGKLVLHRGVVPPSYLHKKTPLRPVRRQVMGRLFMWSRRWETRFMPLLFLSKGNCSGSGW